MSMEVKINYQMKEHHSRVVCVYIPTYICGCGC